MAEKTTVIRNADWIVAWNAAGKSHEYRRDGDPSANEMDHFAPPCSPSPLRQFHLRLRGIHPRQLADGRIHRSAVLPPGVH